MSATLRLPLDLTMFTPREIDRLRFWRWLYETGRVAR